MTINGKDVTGIGDQERRREIKKKSKELVGEGTIPSMIEAYGIYM
jgi:hypothetical protein